MGWKVSCAYLVYCVSVNTYIWKKGTEYSTTLEPLTALANQPYLLTNTFNFPFVPKYCQIWQQ